METKCQSCQGSVFTIKSEGDFLTASTCIQCKRESYNSRSNFCFKFNGLKNSAKKKVALKLDIPEGFREVYNKFWVEQKKSKNKDRIDKLLKNPEEYHIVTEIKQGQVASMHVINRNPIFVGDLKNDRSKYVKISEIDGREIDIPVVREFKGWGNTKVSVNGPILDENDKKVHYACLSIHHQNGSKGLVIVTNYNEIWRAMGSLNRAGAENIARIKRSLERLHQTTVSVKSLDASSYLGGSFFSNLEYEENGTASKILVSLNKDCIAIFQNGEFTPINLEVIYSLKSYARRMYEFSVTHDDSERCMSLKKWQEVLGAEKLTAVDFKKRIKASMQELVTKGICEEESRIEKDLIYTFLKPEHQRRKLDA
jgi:hypothetical protein